MSLTRPVVKTETLKKTKMQPAWILASPWKVANWKVGSITWAQAMGSPCPCRRRPRRLPSLLQFNTPRVYQEGTVLPLKHPRHQTRTRERTPSPPGRSGREALSCCGPVGGPEHLHKESDKVGGNRAWDCAQTSADKPWQ